MNDKGFLFAVFMTMLTVVLVGMSLYYGLWDAIKILATGFGLLLAIGFVGVLFYLIGRMLFGKNK